jgi:hypothetical protein
VDKTHRKAKKVGGNGKSGSALDSSTARDYTKLKGGSAPTTQSIYAKAGARKTSMK